MGERNMKNLQARWCSTFIFLSPIFLSANFFQESCHAHCGCGRHTAEDDEECKARAYEVMRHVFDVHAELGRLFHEKIYQREIAYRVPDARCEVAVDVRFEDFCKINIARPVVHFKTVCKGR